MKLEEIIAITGIVFFDSRFEHLGQDVEAFFGNKEKHPGDDHALSAARLVELHHVDVLPHEQACDFLDRLQVVTGPSLVNEVWDAVARLSRVEVVVKVASDGGHLLARGTSAQLRTATVGASLDSTCYRLFDSHVLSALAGLRLHRDVPLYEGL